MKGAKPLARVKRPNPEVFTMQFPLSRTALTILAASLLVVPTLAQDGGIGKKKPPTGPGPSGPSAPPPPKPNPGGGGGNPQPKVENPPAPSRGGGGGGGGQSNPIPQIPGRRNDPPPVDNNRGDQQGNRTEIRNDNALNRRKQSRSGNVDYGGKVNNTSGSRDRVQPLIISRAPDGRPSQSLESKVRREERVSLSVNGWRVGYYHYDRGWRDDNFCYPFYSFDPYAHRNTYVSPWYYYPTLPAYVVPDRCVFMTYRPSIGWAGRDYRWNRPDDRFHEDEDLDYAIDDLRNAFENEDRRSTGRLVPTRGSVHVNMDGVYRYSLSADDFYDMFQDAIESVRTIDYRILRVRAGRNNAEVLAQHDYRDPWGRRITVYHTYFLELERRSYVIREFGTSDRRW